MLSISDQGHNKKSQRKQTDIEDDLNTNQDTPGQDKINKQIEKIKANVIATMIMEITRRLDQQSKSSVKGFCDKMLFYKKK